MTITPLHVDVLVHAGIHGPDAATTWNSLVGDPDAVGRSLFATGSAGRREYVHRPLPFKLTAAEILKACAFYRYNASRSSSFITRLRDDVGLWVEGSDAAPWGWTGDDVVQRLDRAPLPADHAADPRVEELVQRFASAGIQIQFSDQVHQSLQAAFPAGKRPPIIGTGRIPQRLTVSVYDVVLAANADAAEVAWFWAAGSAVRQARPAHVRQWGGLIVFAMWAPLYYERDESTEMFLQSWGPPDREWSTFDLARQQLAITSSTRAVPIANANQGQTIIATTVEERDRLAARVLDEETRRAISRIDPDRESVIAFVGDDRIGDLVSLQLHDAAWWNGTGGAWTALEVQRTEPSGWAAYATVVVCDRLVEAPDEIYVHCPDDTRYRTVGPVDLPYRA